MLSIDNNNRLLSKLENMKFAENELEWIKNYFKDREMRTILNVVISNGEIVECGVPQGSVLDPPFFPL